MKIKLVSLTKDGNLIVDNKRLQKVIVTKDDMDKIKYKPIVYNKNQQFLKKQTTSCTPHKSKSFSVFLLVCSSSVYKYYRLDD